MTIQTARSNRVPPHPPQVAAVRGIIFQSDARSTLGAIFIRPIEALDRWWAGLSHFSHGKKRTLAMHAGLHVEVQGGSEFVVEQLAGSLSDVLRNGLHWTPVEAFRARDHREAGGWDVTVPLQAFRGIDADVEAEVLRRVATINGRPFWQEDCTGFLGRVFGGRRLFADSPLLHSCGVALRSGEPALPLLRPDAQLDPRAEKLLQADALRNLPDGATDLDTLSMRQLHHRAWAAGALVACGVVLGFGLSMAGKRRAGYG